MVAGAPDYEGVAKQVMRADIYEEAMKEIGVRARRPRRQAGDAVRRRRRSIPAEPEEYAQGVRGQQPEGLSGTMTTMKTQNSNSIWLVCCRCVGRRSCVVLLWAIASAHLVRRTCRRRGKTWEASKPYHRASRSRSAASWTRASCASPGTR